MAAALRLNLDFGNPDVAKKEEITQKVKEAETRKKQASETIEGAWIRILAMKNSDKDRERLLEVKQWMDSDKLEREPNERGKRFSKAEALRLFQKVMEQKRVTILEDMVKNKPDNYILVDNEMAINHLIKVLTDSELVAFDIETFSDEKSEYALNPYKGEVAGFSVSNDDWNFYVPLNHKEATDIISNEPTLRKEQVSNLMERLKPYLEQAKTVMHNAPFDTKWFMYHFNIDMITNLYADTRILAFMMDENRSHRLKDLATDWLGIKSDNFDELFGSKVNFSEIKLAIANVYGCKDTEITLKVFRWIMQWMDREDREDLQKIRRIAFDIEMPVLREFVRMDLRGIGFDIERAKVLDRKYELREVELSEKINSLLDTPINLNSPAQLSGVLYNQLKLTNLDKGSTGSKVLKKIVKEHPIIPLLLEYREMAKLRSSFTAKLPHEVHEDGKIRGSFNTLGAATGRKTSKSPNLQQIPSKHAEVRKLFVPGEGRIFVSIDYS